MFKYYSYSSLYFLKLSLYKYYRIISIIKCKCKQEKNYKFNATYNQKKQFLQYHFNKKK